VLSVHYHHTGVKNRWSWRAIYALALGRFHAITFPSEFIRAEAEALYPRLRTVSHTVYNPIPIPPLPTAADRRAARALLGIPADAPVIGNAGWLIRRKRFDVFLRVAARIRAKIPDARFVIAGDGPERESLQRLAVELGLAPAVRWLGWRTDLAPFYQALNLLLFNSDWDAFGLTPVEALAFGVPVVASVRHGGLRELISDAKWGVLLADHDEPALAAAVVRLLQNAGVARQIGLAGRARVAEVCSEHKCVDAIESLLSGHRGEATG
jgi:glycosyltransferase involved in cell wall biosynthesis